MKKIMTLTALLMASCTVATWAQSYEVVNNRCFADVNADGMDDYIVLTGDAKQPTVNVHFSNGLTFNKIPDIVSRPTNYAPQQGNSFFADVNGDGSADYITFQGSQQTPRIVAYLSSREGFSNDFVVKSAPFDRGYEGYPRGFADINGDGRWDYITFRGQKDRPYIVAYFSTGNGFNPKSYKSAALLEPSQDGITKAFADINGDGMADYMDSYGNGDNINTYLGNKIEYNFQFLYPYQNQLSKPIPSGYNDMPRGYYDIDGDHRADYVVFRGKQDRPRIYIHNSFGQSFEDEPKITREVERGLASMPNGFADVNGDGKWDYIAFRGTEANPKPVVYFSIGNDFIEPTDEMTINLINESAYNAYFMIRYEMEGIEKVIHSPVLQSAKSISYNIPEEAYNVEVTGSCNDCYKKRRIFVDLINRADNPHKVCYRVLGTQFKQYWDYGNCNEARIKY